jgi:hypothetical protein
VQSCVFGWWCLVRNGVVVGLGVVKSAIVGFGGAVDAKLIASFCSLSVLCLNLMLSLVLYQMNS